MNERTFLEAIRAEPDDDAHRLVFADWLEDHGKPTWATLIRRQVKPRDPDGLFSSSDSWLTARAARHAGVETQRWP